MMVRSTSIIFPPRRTTSPTAEVTIYISCFEPTVFDYGGAPTVTGGPREAHRFAVATNQKLRGRIVELSPTTRLSQLLALRAVLWANI